MEALHISLKRGCLPGSTCHQHVNCPPHPHPPTTSTGSWDSVSHLMSILSRAHGFCLPSSLLSFGVTAGNFSNLLERFPRRPDNFLFPYSPSRPKGPTVCRILHPAPPPREASPALRTRWCVAHQPWCVAHQPASLPSCHATLAVGHHFIPSLWDTKFYGKATRSAGGLACICPETSSERNPLTFITTQT